MLVMDCMLVKNFDLDFISASARVDLDCVDMSLSVIKKAVDEILK